MLASDNKEYAVEACLKEIRKVLNDIKFGTVTIVVQDGVPIQLDITEKKRLK